MKNNFKILIGLVIVLVIGTGIYVTRMRTGTVAPTMATSSLLGCYVAHLQKDTYTLIIDTDTLLTKASQNSTM